MHSGPARLSALLSQATTPIPLFIDVLLSNSSHPQSIHKLTCHSLSSDPLFLPSLSSLITSLLTRLNSSKTCQTPETLYTVAHILRLISESHDELSALILEHSESIIPTLSFAYSFLTPNGEKAHDESVMRAKAEVLMLVRRVVRMLSGYEGRDAIKRLMGTRKDGVTLRDQSLRGDYEVFEGAPVAENELSILRQVDQADLDDPRLNVLRRLFPTIPVHLLVESLRHPRYSTSSSRQSPEQQAAPLVDAILNGGSTLPEDLHELRDILRTVPIASPNLDASSHEDSQSLGNGFGKIERRNIWDDQLDLSRLRLKGQVEPIIGRAIPEHLRASILRLVDAQEEEAKAERRALAEADGLNPDAYADSYDDDVPIDRLGGRVLVDADDSDADGDLASSGSEDMPEAITRAEPTSSTRAIQTILELAYLRTPEVFNRDSKTRRSDARQKLKEETGWDDGQLEGWRVMLERNVHKDAILGRHQLDPSLREKTGANRQKNNSQRDGGSGGGGRGGERQKGGGGRDDSGGGSSVKGGRGGEGGGGRGGGRGRGNKSSRGHSNATRTRGHDRKMARMGGGA